MRFTLAVPLMCLSVSAIAAPFKPIAAVGSTPIAVNAANTLEERQRRARLVADKVHNVLAEHCGLSPEYVWTCFLERVHDGEIDIITTPAQAPRVRNLPLGEAFGISPQDLSIRLVLIDSETYAHWRRLRAGSFAYRIVDGAFITDSYNFPKVPTTQLADSYGVDLQHQHPQELIDSVRYGGTPEDQLSLTGKQWAGIIAKSAQKGFEYACTGATTGLAVGAAAGAYFGSMAGAAAGAIGGGATGVGVGAIPGAITGTAAGSAIGAAGGAALFGIGGFVIGGVVGTGSGAAEAWSQIPDTPPAPTAPNAAPTAPDANDNSIAKTDGETIEIDSTGDGDQSSESSSSTNSDDSDDDSDDDDSDNACWPDEDSDEKSEALEAVGCTVDVDFMYVGTLQPPAYLPGQVEYIGLLDGPTVDVIVMPALGALGGSDGLIDSDSEFGGGGSARLNIAGMLIDTVRE